MNKYLSLGCFKDPKDSRDIPMGLVLPKVTIPVSFDFTKLMSPVRNQGDEGTCHSEDTEVLTRDGWKFFPEVKNRDELATINQSTFKLEYQKPSKLHIYDFDDKLYCSSNIHLDFAVTPDHRMFIRKFDNIGRILSSKFEFVKIKDLGWYAGLLNSPKGFEGKYVRNMKIGDKQVNGDDFFKFLGIFLSDGWIRTRKTLRYGYCVGICCFKDEYYDTIYNLLKRLPFKFKEQPTRKGYFTFYGKDLYNFLKPYSINGASEKHTPDFIKNAPSSQIQMFLDFFRLGDGHKTKDNRIWYYTTSKQMADNLQELILKTGKNSSIRITPPRGSWIKSENREIKVENCHQGFVVSIWRTTQLSIDRKKQIYTRHYKGKVYCATVQNSMLITRRNGKVLISGNCVAFASVAGVKEFQDKKEYHKLIRLSPRFLYNLCKKFDGIPFEDGTYPRVAMKVLLNYGVCHESFWPYIPLKKSFPRKGADKDAIKFKIKAYARIKSQLEMKRSLLINGPFVAGVEVFDSWFTKKVESSGFIPMPKPKEDLAGGHAICIVGYDDKTSIFKFKNSWGASWGSAGYGYLPYEYMKKYSSDAWSATDLIENPKALVKLIQASQVA